MEVPTIIPKYNQRFLFSVLFFIFFFGVLCGVGGTLVLLVMLRGWDSTLTFLFTRTVIIAILGVVFVMFFIPITCWFCLGKE